MTTYPIQDKFLKIQKKTLTGAIIRFEVEHATITIPKLNIEIQGKSNQIYLEYFQEKL